MSSERDSHMSLKLKKPPPLKKRHTKPCKYFQVGRCPHPADSCNFAHVPALPGSTSMDPGSPTTSIPPHGVLSMCGYYTTGQCAGESGCGCKHVHDVNMLTTQMNSLQMNPTSPISPTTPFSPEYTYSNQYTYQSFYQTWPPSPPYHDQPSPSILSVLPSKGDSLVISHSTSSDSVSTDGTISQLDTPALRGEGIGFGFGNANVNVNFDRARDDDEIITEDPQFSEHPHKHQSQIRVYDTPTVVDHLPHPHSHSHHTHIPIPVHYHHHHPNQRFGHGIGIGHPVPLSPPPTWNALHYGPPSEFRARSKTPKVNATSRSSSRASSMSKAARFKTKVCKFFNTEQGCPSGDSCTFIHDASIPPVPSVTRSRSKSPEMNAKNEYHEVSQLTNPSLKNDWHDSEEVNQIQKESKSQLSEDEDNNNKTKKKNFFPITWRVIGGGVLVGGNKNKNKHDDDRGMGKGRDYDDGFEDGDHRGVGIEFVEESEPSSPEIETGYINRTGGGGMFGLFGGKKEIVKSDTLPVRPRSMSISSPRIDKERSSEPLFFAAET